MYFYYQLQRPYKIWWTPFLQDISVHPTWPRISPGLAIVAKFGTLPERVALSKRGEALEPHGPGWGSRLDVKKKWEVVHTLLVFVSISFPELSYGSISFHQFSIIVPCSYKYMYMLLCKDMVSCHHRNLEQIEQNRNNNWTHSNVRVHCRPRCCIVGPNLGWLWRKSVPPSWWWIK